MKRVLSRSLLTPAVVAIAAISIVPLLITFYYAFVNFSLLTPGDRTFYAFGNFHFFFTDGAFLPALQNTFVLLFAVMLITVVCGAALALLINEAFPGRALVRVLLISPFLVMPAVNALMWKNMLLNPIYRHVRPGQPGAGTGAGGLAVAVPAAVDHHDGVVAMAAVCLPDFHHVAAVDGPRTARSSGHGWCQLRPETALPLHSAPVARGIGGADDRDDFFCCRSLRRFLRPPAGGPGSTPPPSPS